VLVLQRQGMSQKAGRIQGVFTPAVGSTQCRSVIGKAMSIGGLYMQHTVRINAHTLACGALISFVGHMDAKQRINRLWLVTYQIKKQMHAQLWTARWFYRQ